MLVQNLIKISLPWFEVRVLGSCQESYDPSSIMNRNLWSAFYHGSAGLAMNYAKASSQG